MTTQEKNGGGAATQTLDTTVIEPEEIVNMLRMIRQRIPEYVQLANADARALQAAASVDKAFVDRVIRATGETPLVQEAIGMTPPEMHREMIDSGRWEAVEEELRALLKGVASTNRIRKHRVGLAALQAYNICRQLVRRRAHANLLPHVQEMRALIKAGRKPAVKPDAIPVKQSTQ